jgi:hemolysin III
MSKIEIPKYTLGEELLNAISHGVGALLGIAGLVLTIVFSKTPLAVVSSAIYGTTLIILYTISCLYHSFSPKIKAKNVFRVLDHCSVYLLIFGTYMPYLLLVVKGALGWTLWGILLAMTILGIVLNCVDIEKFKKFSMISYIAMGWVIILSIKRSI